VTWVGPDGVTCEEEFDAVIIATGVRPAIHLCEGLGPRLTAALQSVPHETSEVVVHTDPHFMPLRKSDWMPVSEWCDAGRT
jgi:predicted NAD/FAD-binding protein